MIRKKHVAILGAGIMGSSLALFLSRKGHEVTLFDAEARPFSAASRWNEGKIHLGFLYNADPTMRTARHLIPGGLMFKPVVEELVGCSIDPAITQGDDVYLCHCDSVVQPDEMEGYMHRVAQLLHEHPDARHYLADVSNCAVHRLSKTETAEIADSPMILAGFRTPEKSVKTTWIADRYLEAITAETRINLQMNTNIRSIKSQDNAANTHWTVETSVGNFATYDCVFNALWQGRMAIDQSVGMQPVGIWSHRYRLSLFVRTSKPCHLPCAVIATGPFGDIKNYNNRSFYLSWYPDGLLVDNADISPPDPGGIRMPDPATFTENVFDHLRQYLPWVADIQINAEKVRIEGGWVFAAGRGALSDPASTLHRRSEYGAVKIGSYYSIDTGKYSTAPWVAKNLAEQI